MTPDARLPHVCTEILLCNSHLIMQQLFAPGDAYLSTSAESAPVPR
jgi:hypothetical protein